MSASIPNGLLEDEAAAAILKGGSVQIGIAMSKAISLKRIADALTGAGENIFNRALNAYGENIGECIQGQFERSQR